MTNGETRRRLTRLQNIADYGVNRSAYLHRQLDQLEAIKGAKDDPARFWSSSYRFARDFRSPAPPLGPKKESNPDALLCLAFTFVAWKAQDEMSASPIVDEVLAALDAVREKYGWPKEDEDGDDWEPEAHIPEGDLPGDYLAQRDEAEVRLIAEEDAIRRRVFVRYDVEDILDLQERDREEFERRLKAGRAVLGWDSIFDERSAD